MPQRLVVLGGGVIGVEFASIYAQFGSAVTVIEMLPNLIGNEDADAVAGAAEGVPPPRHRRRAGLARDRRGGAATAISC